MREPSRAVRATSGEQGRPLPGQRSPHVSVAVESPIVMHPPEDEAEDVKGALNPVSGTAEGAAGAVYNWVASAVGDRKCSPEGHAIRAGTGSVRDDRDCVQTDQQRLGGLLDGQVWPLATAVDADAAVLGALERA